MKFVKTTLILWALLCSIQILVAQEYPDPEEFVYVDQQPSPINLSDVRASIGYPEDAVEENVEGTVLCRVLVDENGSYLRHLVLNSPASILQRAVDEKISQLKFSPATKDGKTIAYWINVPFRFKLISQQTRELETLLEAQTDSLTGMREDYDLWYRRSLVYLRLNQTKEAMSDIEEAISLNPQKNKRKLKKNTYPSLIKAYYAKASILNKDRDTTGAIYYYSEVLRLAEEMKVESQQIDALLPQAYLERGYLYLTQDSFEQAKQDLRIAARDTADFRCTAFQLLANIGISKDAFPELVEYYDGLVDCYPDRNLLRYSRGYYAAKAGMYERALEDFEFVIENIKLNELRVSTFNQMAYCYLNQDEFDKAIEAIDNALLLNVLNGEAYYYRGLVYMKQGMTQRACQNIEKSLKYSSESDYREKAIKLMEETCGGFDDE